MCILIVILFRGGREGGRRLNLLSDTIPAIREKKSTRFGFSKSYVGFIAKFNCNDAQCVLPFILEFFVKRISEGDVHAKNMPYYTYNTSSWTITDQRDIIWSLEGINSTCSSSPVV